MIRHASTVRSGSKRWPDPRPLSRHRRAELLYTLNCEEPVKVNVLSDSSYQQPRFVDSKCAAKVRQPASRWFGLETGRIRVPLTIVGEGTNEIQRNVIAAQLVARGGN